MTADQLTDLLKVIQPDMPSEQRDTIVAAYAETADGTDAQKRSLIIAGMITGMQAEAALEKTKTDLADVTGQLADAKKTVALYLGIIEGVRTALRPLDG